MSIPKPYEPRLDRCMGKSILHKSSEARIENSVNYKNYILQVSENKADLVGWHPVCTDVLFRWPRVAKEVL